MSYIGKPNYSNSADCYGKGDNNHDKNNRPPCPPPHKDDAENDNRINIINKPVIKINICGVDCNTDEEKPHHNGDTKTYDADLSAPDSVIRIPLADLLLYQIARVNETTLLMSFAPVDGPVTVDYKYLSHYNTTVHDSAQGDGITVGSPVIIDQGIMNSSQEFHKTWIRVQNPETQRWNLYEVSLYASAGGARVTIAVTTLEENVEYGA